MMIQTPQELSACFVMLIITRIVDCVAACGASCCGADFGRSAAALCRPLGFWPASRPPEQTYQSFTARFASYNKYLLSAAF